MESDEVLAEIERRKQQAKNLKIRELLWSLYIRFKGYETRKNRTFIYPEIAASLKTLGNTQEFSLNQSLYRFVYSEGPPHKSEYLGRGELSERTTVSATLALHVESDPVFQFEIRRSTSYLDDGPVSKDDVGAITCFMEGRWIEELQGLMERIREHEKSVANRLNSPKLEEMKKRFGI